ncbi:MAG: D-arabinose 5-phosphate isomerase [Gammaproteobacteria bacterium]|nr:D-arabinose 5-phosphate isomerase [Gammaproteobacteria bacterium]|tara:strand:- start:534 stop:1505 length:972 start_codon:yes stop_codon:yes gene_type:complete
MSETDRINSAKRTISIELRAVSDLLGRLDHKFEEACEIILASTGRVVVIGMGKSGHVGRKIAATLASTGTIAMFVHPAEASHGDIGMIASDDVVIMISNSGKTEEIIDLLPILKRKKTPLITLSGDPNSEIAKAASANLDVSISEEACPLGLAPTSSTTAALVMGDALAMALLEARGFTQDDFAFSHPGGNLGRKLLIRVSDVMQSGEAIPKTNAKTSLADALFEISTKGFGLTTVVDDNDKLIGVFTDGDLRRSIDSGIDLHETSISHVLSRNFKHIKSTALAAEAAAIMQSSNVYVLIVMDQPAQLTGLIKMHDLLTANVV